MKKFLVILSAIVLLWSNCYSQEWLEPDSFRQKYMLQGRYDSALYYADEAAAIMRGTIGENNIQYGLMMRKLAYSHFYLGNYTKAKYFILREAGLWESLKKTKEPEYLNCLMAASIICRKGGEYEEALTLIKKADKKALDLYKSDSPEYAEILYNYAGVYHDMGSARNDMIFLNQEEKYLKQAQSVYRQNGETSKREAFLNISDQAAWNNNIGNLAMAEKMLLQVAEYCSREFGSESRGYASALNNVAVFYYNSGNYKLAENSFNEALRILKSDINARKTETGICLNNLGAMYYKIGNFENASKLIREAAEVYKNNHQVEDPVFAVILNNLASVGLSQEYYASPDQKKDDRLATSGRLILEADSIFRINCRKPHPYDLSITGNLGILYYFKGDKTKSFQTFLEMNEDSNYSLRVVAMMNKMSMSAKLPSTLDHDPSPEAVLIPISNSLFNEVNASLSTGSSSDDAKGFTSAIFKIFIGKAEGIKKAVGPYHPAYIEILKQLVIAYASINDFKTEEELTLQYMSVINQKMLQDFSYLSESEKEMYYQTRLVDLHAFESYSLMRKKGNPMITRSTYDNILLSKGLMLKSSTAMRLSILNSNNPALLKEYDNWIALQKEISALYSTPVEMREKDVSELENTSKTLERSLVARSQDFSDFRNSLQVTWEDVRKSLKPDEAAIEFTDFRRREKDGGNALTYCALVLRSDSEYPEMIKLFTDDQLKAIIEKSGGNNIGDINDIYGTRALHDEKLYNLIWKPIEQYLEGVSKVFISPSGLLHKISFPAISNGKGVYLCDRYQISVKGSTGTITAQNLFSTTNKSSAMVLGGIQYSAVNSADAVWGYLKGTKDEGDAISTILKKGNFDVQYLSGNNATETFFKEKAGSYNMLHLATHGFFFDDPNKVRFEEKKQEVEFGKVVFRGASSSAYGVNSFVNSENPLMRSGLVLAGANDVWAKSERTGTEDGVLTAQEVAQIDLRKNDLVVLSACETGLGDIKGTEGVYGLQRSLKMAGVKYIIMSLWEIPDRETVEFMGLFYSNLLKDKDIKKAFYSSQRTMRAKYDPYYWGAFVLLE